jgi:hypothetical protein
MKDRPPEWTVEGAHAGTGVRYTMMITRPEEVRVTCASYRRTVLSSNVRRNPALFFAFPAAHWRVRLAPAPARTYPDLTRVSDRGFHAAPHLLGVGLANRGRPRRGATALVAASALALTAPACGLGDKDRMADAVIGSVDAAHRAGTARGTLTASMRIAELPGDVVVDDIAGAGGDQAFETAPIPVEIDFTAGRAALVLERPFEIFDGLTIYGFRFGVGEREARPWVKVDLEASEDLGELDLQEDPPVLLMNALSPVLIVDLIAGALTGSIDRAGTDEIDGLTITRYDANFDVDKTLRDTRREAYDEERRDAVDELFDALKVKGSVHAGQAWIDGEGLPRRFAITFPVEPRHGFVVDVELRLELEEFGGPVDIEPPSDGELLEVGSLIALFRAVVPSSGNVVAPPGEAAP